ncbi:MAG: GNAT family N-acetyltransferase [Gemmatimonadales bacterium]|nr:GNAT family N-acetyltransferase [Gemmatimonadales bacterium]MBA3556012.1 GNAT family N-acetyltransferase [Gemmatimonadales bacterium]
MMKLRRKLSGYLDDWRTFPGDAALGYRNEGLRGVRDALVTRTVHRVVRTGGGVIFAQRLDAAVDVAPPAGVRVAEVTDADWPALATLVSRRDLARFRRLAAAGRVCLVAWRETRPIGYAWVADRIGSDVSLCPLPLPAHAAYLWDLYVLPSERSSGIGSALARARLAVARAHGFREGWRLIARANLASLRTLKKSGSDGEIRTVGEIRFVKLFSRLHARFIPCE